MQTASSLSLLSMSHLIILLRLWVVNFYGSPLRPTKQEQCNRIGGESSPIAFARNSQNVHYEKQKGDRRGEWRGNSWPEKCSLQRLLSLSRSLAKRIHSVQCSAVCRISFSPLVHSLSNHQSRQQQQQQQQYYPLCPSLISSFSLSFRHSGRLFFSSHTCETGTPTSALSAALSSSSWRAWSLRLFFGSLWNGHLCEWQPPASFL